MLEENFKIELLEREYDRVHTIIENYTNRQLNFMNFTILLIGGSFLYFQDKLWVKSLKEFYPYYIFLIYGLFALDFYRIQVFQGYRQALAEEINTRLMADFISTPKLTDALILNPKENWFYVFYSMTWMILLIAIYVYSHIEVRFKSPHALIQFLIIGGFIPYFIYVQKSVRKKSFNMVKEKFPKEAEA